MLLHFRTQMPILEIDPMPLDARHIIVSQSVGADANDGTPEAPKKTLAGALAVAASPAVIEARPGTYAESIAPAVANFLLEGRGANGANLTEIRGTVTAGAERLRLVNWNLDHLTQPGFVWTAANGKHQLRGVSFSGSGVSFAPAAAARGWAVLAECDFSAGTAPANILLPGLSGGTASLSLNFCTGARIGIGAGWTVFVSNSPTTQIVGNAGTLIYSDNGLALPFVNAILPSQAALTALLADTSVLTDGYYICDFASPSVGARGDILLKASVNGLATSILPHRPLAQAPASVYVQTAGKTYLRSAAGWAAAA